ncbi:SDR family NAD(P)-dependent oxidoreductase [Paenibacillus sp. P25]|nr:SDR family NAD(P)-dependent oxidoreductase [Paenibacillus sp. P25]
MNGDLFSGLAGLLKAAQSENSKLVGQVIEMETGIKDIAVALVENSRCPSDHRIRYRNGKRWIAVWNELTAPEEPALPWKDNGVYVITGGAGGLGLIFAKEIAEKARGAALILTGRSPLSPEKESGLDELRALGAAVEYRQADVTSLQQVTSLLKSIREEHGALNGIIHAAGIIRDNLIVKKSAEELREVLSSKAAGLVNLDEASKDMPLDFLIAFSSVAGALGNPGQSDYSAANAFMDAYAAYRNELAYSGLKTWANACRQLAALESGRDARRRRS